MSDIARIDRLEVVIEQHDELIGRCVQAMEQQIKLDERLANHLAENQRQWAILDEHSQRLAAMTNQVSEMLAFYAFVKRLMRPLIYICGTGILFLIGYWMEKHGWLG